MIDNKPFLQVEFEQNEKKKEIHEHLHYFYVKGNKLFDKNFLKWYLKYWFQVDLSDNYILHIIDILLCHLELADLSLHRS